MVLASQITIVRMRPINKLLKKWLNKTLTLQCSVREAAAIASLELVGNLAQIAAVTIMVPHVALSQKIDGIRPRPIHGLKTSRGAQHQHLSRRNLR